MASQFYLGLRKEGQSRLDAAMMVAAFIYTLSANANDTKGGK